MSHNQGADELRIQTHLRKLVDGPTAEPPPMPPGPPPDGYRPARPRDWLDDILDSTTTPAKDKPADGPKPEPPGPASKAPAGKSKKRKKKRRRPDPAAPRTAFDSQPEDPRQSLLDAYDRIPTRVRWLIYHATAAAAGWQFGWVDWSTDTAAWYAAGHWVTPSAFALYGLGALACGVYRRSRGWAWPIAWAAAIPVSSIAAGIALYGTGYPS